MRDKVLICCVIILAFLNIFVCVYVMDMANKYDELKANEKSLLRKIDRDRLDVITLRPNESINITMENEVYEIKLLDVRENEPCSTTSPGEGEVMPMPCAWFGDYSVSVAINGVELWLTSELNYSHPLISTDFWTNYIIYYLPDYGTEEASFLIELDKNYEKEQNIIVGNYLVYLNEDNKVLDITTFTNEPQRWGLKYVGMRLQEIGDMIRGGKKLEEISD